MAGMRAVSVLLAVLGLAAPQVSWNVIELSSDSSAATSMSMSAPAVAGSQFVRDFFKADKAFGSNPAIAVDVQPLFPPFYSVDGHSTGRDQSPSLDLDGPPLAPRPPPLA